MYAKVNKITHLPLRAHMALAVFSVGWFQWAKSKLDASYAASQYPVDYVTAQTSFSGKTLKEYFATMSEAGTLDIYVRTQMIDFLFILGFLGIGLFVCTLFARLGRPQSLGRRLGTIAGLAVIAGGLCDMIENAWSFVMLANPSDFADWLAIPYSTFAAVKFGLIALGLALLVASLASTLVGYTLCKPKIG